MESGEHTKMGDRLNLRNPNYESGISGEVFPLHLGNGLRLTYGQIIALSGDFYGIPERPISDGNTPEEKRERFRQCFHSLANKEESYKEATEILDIMRDEGQKVQNGGGSQAYGKIGTKINEKYNMATREGLFCLSPHPLYPPGRYLDLASHNWDHFGQHAVEAYKAGHSVALDHAVYASRLSDKSGRQHELCIAYALSAFADHFLTDLFSAGHLRVPRKKLHDARARNSDTDTIGLGEVVVNLCAMAMHAEDSRLGLKVRNLRKDNWTAYGDKYYFDKENTRNREMAEDAVIASAGEVYKVFEKPESMPNPEQYEALRYIPVLEDFADHEDRSLGNHAPLYVVKNGVVLVRARLLERGCYEWNPVRDYGKDVLSFYAEDQINDLIGNVVSVPTDLKRGAEVVGATAVKVFGSIAETIIGRR
jgi:hypothetical protein